MVNKTFRKNWKDRREITFLIMIAIFFCDWYYSQNDLNVMIDDDYKNFQYKTIRYIETQLPIEEIKETEEDELLRIWFSENSAYGKMIEIRIDKDEVNIVGFEFKKAFVNNDFTKQKIEVFREIPISNKVYLTQELLTLIITKEFNIDNSLKYIDSINETYTVEYKTSEEYFLNYHFLYYLNQSDSREARDVKRFFKSFSF